MPARSTSTAPRGGARGAGDPGRGRGARGWRPAGQGSPSEAVSRASQGEPILVTRNGKVLGQISTRRYFCMQCHVPQEAVRPLVNNQFEDVDTVIRKGQAAPAGHKK